MIVSSPKQCQAESVIQEPAPLAALLSGLVAGADPDAKHVVRHIGAHASAARTTYEGRLGHIHG